MKSEITYEFNRILGTSTFQEVGYPTIINCHNITRIDKSPIHVTNAWRFIRVIRSVNVAQINQIIINMRKK